MSSSVFCVVVVDGGGTVEVGEDGAGGLEKNDVVNENDGVLFA